MAETFVAMTVVALLIWRGPRDPADRQPREGAGTRSVGLLNAHGSATAIEDAGR
jgi:hypothetical protein